MKRLSAFFIIVLFLTPLCLAAKADMYLVDTPTAETLAARSVAINTRLFSGGGVLAYFDFGVLQRLSIGTSITLEHLIGTNDEHVKVLVPALQLKYRPYDGGDILPAVVVGFDNQGFDYDHDDNEYRQKGRGVYLALSRELFLSGFVLTGGVNYTIDKFKFDKLAGFTGAIYNIEDIVSLMLEWDNIRTFDESRWNGGVRFYLSENFSFDLAIRNFNNKAERIGQIKYIHRL